MNKFEQVSSDGHQMPLAGTGLGWGIPCLDGVPGPGLRGSLYSEVQCIVCNGDMGSPSGQTDRHTSLKTLPSRNSVGGR